MTPLNCFGKTLIANDILCYCSLTLIFFNKTHKWAIHCQRFPFSNLQIKFLNRYIWVFVLLLVLNLKHLFSVIWLLCRYQILGVFLLIQLCVIAAEALRRRHFTSIASSVHQASFATHNTSAGYIFFSTYFLFRYFSTFLFLVYVSTNVLRTFSSFIN